MLLALLLHVAVFYSPSVLVWKGAELEFKHVGEVMSDAYTGQRVCIRGWIYRRSVVGKKAFVRVCLLYTSPSPRD